MTLKNDSRVLFPAACGSDNPFWDPDVSWHTSSPDLTICFLKTVPFWLPSALLWLATVLVCLLGPRKGRRQKGNRTANERDFSSIDREVTSAYDEISSSLSLGASFLQLARRWRSWSLLFAIKIIALPCLILLTAIGRAGRE